MNPMFEAVHSDADSSFRCLHVSCERFADDHTWHYHPEYELAYVVSSRGTRFVGDSIQRYEPRDLVLLGPDLPHCWSDDPHSPGESVPELRVIQFSTEAFGEGFLALNEAKRLKRLLEASKAGLHFQGPTTRHAGELMRQAMEATGLGRLLMLLEVLNFLAEADAFDVLATQDYCLNNTANPANRERIEYVYRHIRENLSGEISQAQLAATLNMSASAFSRFFKAATGKNFVAFVNILRINEVCRQLGDSERLVTQIAMACGYNNVSNFNRQFLVCKGMSPSEYRQRFKRKSQQHQQYVEARLAN